MILEQASWNYKAGHNTKLDAVLEAMEGLNIQPSEQEDLLFKSLMAFQQKKKEN
jgi:hypothetical protein